MLFLEQEYIIINKIYLNYIKIPSFKHFNIFYKQI